MVRALTLLALLALAFTAVGQTQHEVIAAVLIGEAGGEGRKGMESVFEVIHTRSVQLGRSHYRAVTQPYQFSCLNRTSQARLVKASRRHSSWALALKIASQPRPLTNWTKGANHYHEVTINPGWPNRTVKVGRHIFYRFS